MTDYKKALEAPEYNFLAKDARLKNIILLGVSGSHGYGTNVEGSDLDVRGIAVNSSREILLGRDFEQVCDSMTDTVIYSLRKAVRLLSSCNPNMIEMLGLKPEHYLRLSPVGKALIENSDMFLSRVAIKSFGGYANQVLTRLTNDIGEGSEESKRVRERRNSNAIRHNKVGKHAMHLVRLHYMAFDILEKGIIKTYRDEEHDLLMSIRNGDFLTTEGKPNANFYAIVEGLTDRLAYAKKHTVLPEKPDIERIEDFLITVHKQILIEEG